MLDFAAKPSIVSTIMPLISEITNVTIANQKSPHFILDLNDWVSVEVSK
jgi:hypothetical protein